MPEMPLKQLGVRIDNGEEVQPNDVAKAYADEMVAVKDKYDKLGKSGDSPEVKGYMERLGKTRDRLLDQLKELSEARKKATGDIEKETLHLRKRFLREVNASIAMREEVNKDTDAEVKRHEQITAALNNADAATDPGADGALIPDYEGWGTGNDLTDENFNNVTRWTLSGWVAAHKMRGDEFAAQELTKAAGIYEKSDDGIFTVDNVLKYDEMVDGMNMKSHLDAVAKFNLTAESTGFLAGYLAVATAQMNEDQAKKYKSFLITQVEALGNQLNYQDKNTDDEHYNYIKGRFEIDVLKSVLTPGEWIEKNKEVSARFVSIKRKADEVSKGLELNFNDPWLRTFLGKSADDITFEDTADLNKAEETIQSQAISKLGNYKNNLEGAHKNLVEKADALKKKNEILKHFSDEQIDVINKKINYAKDGVEKIIVNGDEGFDEMIGSTSQVKTSLNYMESVSVNIAEMDKEIDEAKRKKVEEEKKKKEDEEAVKKAAPAPGGAGKPAEGKSAKEKKETVSAREKFIKEKNLDEQLVGSDYNYSLGKPQYGVHMNGYPVLDFENEDVQKLIGKKLNDYFKGLGNRFFNDEVGSKMAKLMKKPDYNFGMTFDFIVANKKKMKPEVVAEIDRMTKVMDLFTRALTESTMKFDTRPTGKKLKSEYKKVFVPAWERAAKDFDDITGSADEKEKTREVAKGLELLDKQPYPEYEEALRKLVVHGNDSEGVDFKLPYAQGTNIYCNFKRDLDGGYKLNYENGSLKFDSITDAAKNINDGLFHRHYMDGVLKNDVVFERYEDLIGTLDKNVQGDKPRSRWLELDWTNPDAQVAIIAAAHGKLGYRINRENIGPLGENNRIMFAESIADFAQQVAHLRKWAEGDDHSSQPGAAARKENLFDAITNPYTFRTANVEKKIGHIERFDITKGEVVRMRLKWGGKREAILAVWVDARGDLKYSLDGPAGGGAGVRVGNVNEVIRRVAAARVASVLPRE